MQQRCSGCRLPFSVRLCTAPCFSSTGGAQLLMYACTVMQLQGALTASSWGWYCCFKLPGGGHCSCSCSACVIPKCLLVEWSVQQGSSLAAEELGLLACACFLCALSCHLLVCATCGSATSATLKFCGGRPLSQTRAGAAAAAAAMRARIKWRFNPRVHLSRL